MAEAARRVLLAGASGLVGRCLLERLLGDPTVATVQVLARRPLPRQHAKLVFRQVDFATPMPLLDPVDEVYLALGTTIKVAGSQDAFRAVDFDANLAVARAAQRAGARRCGLVSAMGANARSGVFYSRVKGELEAALADLPWQALVIARPSLLVGDRRQLGQPQRRGEVIGEAIGRLLGPLVPGNYRPIMADQVAAALLRAVPGGSGQRVLPSGQMRGR